MRVHVRRRLPHQVQQIYVRGRCVVARQRRLRIAPQLFGSERAGLHYGLPLARDGRLAAIRVASSA